MEIKDGQYVSIPSFARLQLCLSGNELITYSLIYGFSQDGKSVYHGGLQYIADWCGLSSKIRAKEVVDRLIEKGVVEKEEIVINGVKFVNYRAKRYGVSERDTGVSERDTNNIGYNIPPITIVEDKSSPIDNILQCSSKRFTKPSIEEVEAYCIERNNGIDAKSFYNFYESKGWMVGSNHMKDWKAAVRTWEGKEKKSQYSIQTNGKSFEERRADFYNSLVGYVPKYGRDFVRAFYIYWAQQTTDGLYMLWETKPAFEVEKRLEEQYLKQNSKR